MREFIIPVVVVILIIGMFICGAEVGNTVSHNRMKKEYNNGICPECGGTYHFSQAVGHHSSTHYIYICSNCKKLVEVDTYYE